MVEYVEIEILFENKRIIMLLCMCMGALRMETTKNHHHVLLILFHHSLRQINSPIILTCNNFTRELKDYGSSGLSQPHETQQSFATYTAL